MLTIRRTIGLSLAFATAALLVALVQTKRQQANPPGRVLAALSQTYIAFKPPSPLHVPTLQTASKLAFTQTDLQGHWSLLFFGFTACPMVCPRTLSLLSLMARISDSGISSGSILPVFVSIDPEHDSPAQIAIYLRQFDHHIVGLTGSREAVRNFSREIGVGYQLDGSSINHSTSLFVVDPAGRLAGIILRPDNPNRILADLHRIQTTEIALLAN